METNQPAEIEFSLHPVPGRQRPNAGTGRLPRVTRVLALALSFQEMVASGNAKNYEELAERAGVTAERLSQVMKLIWLAPEIQEQVLYLPGCGGRHPLTEAALRTIASHWLWPEQIELWNELKGKLHLQTSSHPDELHEE